MSHTSPKTQLKIEVAGLCTIVQNHFLQVVILDNNFFLKRWKIHLNFSTSSDSTSVAVRGDYFAVGPLFTFINFKNRTTKTVDQLWSHVELGSGIEHWKGVTFWRRGWIWLEWLFRFTAGVSSTCPVAPPPSGRQRGFCPLLPFCRTKPPPHPHFEWEGFSRGQSADAGTGWKLPPCNIPNLKQIHPQGQKSFCFWPPPGWALRGSWGSGSSSTQRSVSCESCACI